MSIHRASQKEIIRVYTLSMHCDLLKWSLHLAEHRSIETPANLPSAAPPLTSETLISIAE